MELWIRAEVHRLTNIRANQNRRMGDPGPEGSIGKMESANLNKAIYEAMIDVMYAIPSGANIFPSIPCK